MTVPVEDERGAGPIDLVLPATGANAAIVRILAATLATDLDFSIDRIDDLRLITGEFFSLVIELCQPSNSIPLRIEIHMDSAQPAIHLQSAGATLAHAAPPEDDLRWIVLTALASSAQLQIYDGTYAFDIMVEAQ